MVRGSVNATEFPSGRFQTELMFYPTAWLGCEEDPHPTRACSAIHGWDRRGNSIFHDPGPVRSLPQPILQKRPVDVDDPPWGFPPPEDPGAAPAHPQTSITCGGSPAPRLQVPAGPYLRCLRRPHPQKSIQADLALCGTSGIEHVFLKEPDPIRLILSNVAFSYVPLGGDPHAANRFYLGDLAVGLMRPPFNVDVER